MYKVVQIGMFFEGYGSNDGRVLGFFFLENINCGNRIFFLFVLEGKRKVMVNFTPLPLQVRMYEVNI